MAEPIASPGDRSHRDRSSAGVPTSGTDPLRVGIVGVGTMGADHARRIAGRTAGARLVAVADFDPDRARSVAAEYAGVRAIPDAAALIADPEVEAVLLASPGSAHEEQVLACLAHGKPTLCEKPLTMDSSSALRVLRAEQELGRRLVQVGFMRRFDPEYAQLKRTLVDGELGRILLVHNVHRNRSAPPGFTSEMIVRDSLVHEVDVARFLFGQEITRIQVLAPAPSSLAPQGLRDPQVAIFTMAGGGLVTSEVFVNHPAGYEVRCEAVGERGSVVIAGLDSMAEPGPKGLAVQGGRVLSQDFRDRFGQAYGLELQAWVDAIRAGTQVGPGAWDGYAATVVCEAGITSLATGVPVDVELAGARS